MTRSEVGLRLGIFIFVAAFVWLFTPVVLRGGDLVTVSVAASLAAGLAANVVSVRAFEEGRFRDFGLGARVSGVKQLAVGFGLGAGAVGVLAGGAVAVGWARFEQIPGEDAWPWWLLTLVLFCGALGEELLFRGYPFQYLARTWNAWAMIVGTGVLFGLAHMGTNPNIDLLGALNTALWGALFGYAYWRTRALWLPTGLHFGWNLGLVLIGAPLSGITIRVTGFGLRWNAGDAVSGGEYGPEGGVLATVLGSVLLVLLKRGR